MSEFLTILDLERLAKHKLSQKRYNHTINVRDLAMNLADKFDANIKQVAIAAMLHDITKEENINLQLQILQKSDIIVPCEELSSPALYHAKTAYLFTRDKLSVSDTVILNAIYYHTTGAKNMSLEEKIIYVADAVSADRKYKGVEEYRKIAFIDLDICMFKIISFSIQDQLAKKYFVPVDEVECYNELLKTCKKR